MTEVDELVWGQVLTLLEDPTLIEAEIQRRLGALRAADPASQRREGLQRDLARAENAVRRLIDGYQEQLITLEELRGRSPELRTREATLRAELDALDAARDDAETYLKLTETLEGFRARLTDNAAELTVEQRQQIVRLVVREVLIGDDDVTIRHSIPTPAGDQPPGSRLRWDSREVPDPGARSHGADFAHAPRGSRARPARLSPLGDLKPVRGAGPDQRQGHRRPARPPPRDRVQAVPADPRPRGPRAPGRPPGARQQLHPQDAGDPEIAAGSPQVRLALHGHQLVLAEPRRALVCRTDQQALRRGAHRSVHALNRDIRAGIDTWNDNRRPFVWTKTPDEILDSMARYCNRINESRH
jgi:hypothetical protein